eukprot:TRINITY_DN21789_c1_g1_i2.p1 TRINITY_DN21789_c1_g1~~TRINITY_DN21789_c1_g1_i2.p1  ORF type:complete len:365 (-),score=79.68 TRINITY_DN21789_c1_g1_i2:69-1163(-)
MGLDHLSAVFIQMGLDDNSDDESDNVVGSTKPSLQRSLSWASYTPFGADMGTSKEKAEEDESARLKQDDQDEQDKQDKQSKDDQSVSNAEWPDTEDEWEDLETRSSPWNGSGVSSLPSWASVASLETEDETSSMSASQSSMLPCPGGPPQGTVWSPPFVMYTPMVQESPTNSSVFSAVTPFMLNAPMHSLSWPLEAPSPSTRWRNHATPYSEVIHGFSLAVSVSVETAGSDQNDKAFGRAPNGMPPPISIQDYVARLQRCFDCPEKCFVLALIYISRASKASPAEIRLTALTAHRIILVALTVAVKFSCETVQTNDDYAQAGGIDTQELGDLEFKLLKLLGTTLDVDDETYERMNDLLRVAAAQ